MNYSVTPLFAIPLYHASVNISNDLTELINDLDFERMPADNGDYTVDKYILERSEFAELKSLIHHHIDNLVYEVLNCHPNTDFEIQNSWINRHQPGDWATSHRHNNSILSGVFYIDVDDNSGYIQFEKDRSYYNLWTDTVSIDFSDDLNKLNFFNTEAWAITPKKNDLVLFPSLLYHSVSENKSTKVRYSLAFNIFPRGKLGGTLNTLRI